MCFKPKKYNPAFFKERYIVFPVEKTGDCAKSQWTASKQNIPDAFHKKPNQGLAWTLLFAIPLVARGLYLETAFFL